MKYAVGLIATQVVVATFFFGCQGCGGGDPFSPEADAWLKEQNMDELVKEYHSQLYPVSTPETNSQRSLFIDFSSGIGKLLRNSNANQDFLDLVLAKASGNGFNFYELEDREVEKMTGTDGQIKAKAFDWASYEKTLAPITDAIAQLQEDGRSGIFVTDWEEYQPQMECSPEVTKNPYAADVFKKWLKNGGRIEFRYLDRATENNHSVCTGYIGESQKHIYFTFFIAQGDQAMEATLADIDRRWAQNHVPASKFALSQGMQAAYQNPEGGMVEYLKGLDFTRIVVDESSEIITFPENTDKYAQKYLVDGTMTAQNDPANNGYWNKGIVFDSEQNELFKVTKVDIRVSDATVDFSSFLAERMLESYSATVESKIVTDPNSKAEIWDVDSQTQLMLNCFEENTAIIKKKYSYKPTDALEVKQLFEMAEGSIEQLTNAPRNVELNLMLAKNPDPSALLCNNRGKLLKVEYYVPADGFIDPLEDELGDFSWYSVTLKNEENVSLKNSIVATAENCGPNDEASAQSYVLYTQYYAFFPSGFSQNISDLVLAD